VSAWRLDRLRDTEYAALAGNALLGLLPYRRDLPRGHPVLLYKSFDALADRDPQPLDYTVTFLAARIFAAFGARAVSLPRRQGEARFGSTWRL